MKNTTQNFKNDEKRSPKTLKNASKCPGRCVFKWQAPHQISIASLLAKCPRAHKSRKSVSKELHRSAPIGAKKSAPKRLKIAKKTAKMRQTNHTKIAGKIVFFWSILLFFSPPFRRHFRRFFDVFWTRGAACLAQRPPRFLSELRKIN